MSADVGRPYAEVIGDPVSQSKSPAIHGFWLEKLGIEADYRATRVPHAGVSDWVAKRRSDPAWCGANVTMPLKQAVQGHLQSVEHPADTIGAVNTICPASDRLLVGYNTDATGFLEPLRPLLARQHYFRMARIIGTGGAARAIVSALEGEGFTVVLAGRNPAKARAILDELAPDGGHHAADLALFATPTDFAFDDREGCCDLIVNASALGMKGQPPLDFDWSHAPPGSIAYDIVTDPVETEFLTKARAAGFRTIDGLSMLIGQAAAAFERFFGATPPRDCDDELRERLTS